MTRLSVKALRLYDEIGLLEPSHVDPSSGYRYYRLGQANRAEAVRILRSVEMPLDEIKAVLDADHPDLSRKLLIAHRERLADRLANQERMLAYLETLIDREEGVMPYDVQIMEEPALRVAATRRHTALSQIGDTISAGFGALMGAMGRSQLVPTGPPLIVYHDVIDEETEGDIEICIPVSGTLPAGEEVYGRELEAGPMATTVHHGPYDQIAPAYQIVTSWISEHGHEMAGPPRETYLNDPQTVAPEDLLTRIEFPIKPDTNV
jgi:effector-binding domain-containing protein